MSRHIHRKASQVGHFLVAGFGFTGIQPLEQHLRGTFLDARPLQYTAQRHSTPDRGADRAALKWITGHLWLKVAPVVAGAFHRYGKRLLGKATEVFQGEIDGTVDMTIYDEIPGARYFGGRGEVVADVETRIWREPRLKRDLRRFADHGILIDRHESISFWLSSRGRCRTPVGLSPGTRTEVH